MNHSALKPQAQLSLETVLKQNRDEAENLTRAAQSKLDENARIQAEMHKILSEPPPPPVSRLMEAFSEGVRATTTTMPSGVDSTRMVAEKEVLYAALAMVRSWQRRHKKHFHNQEKELMNAVERLTWDK